MAFLFFESAFKMSVGREQMESLILNFGRAY